MTEALKSMTLYEPPKHGIDEVGYFLIKEGGSYDTPHVGALPTFLCFCEYEAVGNTWEEAGAELDKHFEHKRI